MHRLFGMWTSASDLAPVGQPPSTGESNRGPGGVVARWGDLQGLAARPERAPVLGDVGDFHFADRRSSSAPKKAAALLRIKDVSKARLGSPLTHVNAGLITLNAYRLMCENPARLLGRYPR